MNDFQVKVSLIDPDYEEDRGPHDAVLRIERRSFSTVGGHRWIPFSGPRVVQYLLTPLFAMTGLLTVRRDITWTDEPEETPRLRVTACVPPDFWCEFAFATRHDAESARQMIDQIW